MNFKLKHPITWGSETIAELTMRRPKAKDFRNVNAKMNLGDILNLAGKLCNQPPAVMDELDPEDMMPILDAVGKFIPGSPRTGKKR